MKLGLLGLSKRLGEMYYVLNSALLKSRDRLLGAMLSVQFITLLYVLTIKFDNEKKD